MAAFYARYVPPSKSPERPETYDQPSSKRKHEDNQEQLEASRKRSRTETADKAEQITRKQSAPTFQELHSGKIQGARDDGETSSIGRKMSHRGKPHSEGKEVLAKYSSIKAAEKSDDTYVSKLERRAGEAGALRSDPSTTELPTVYVKTRRETPKDATRDRAATTQDGDQPNPAVDEAQSLNSLHDRRYSAIRQKFEKSKAQSSATTLTRELDDKKRQGHGQSENGMEEAVAAAQRHGLEPLPQPPQPEPSTELPAYSTLPGWMATPLQVPSSFTAAFRDLNVDKHLVSNLGSKGLDKAFAVQAAVLPLLSEGKSRHRGDICISAATGSGKTLAYVLPLVQALKGVAGTKLRGLIVVPTRELVAQAREVCELCAAGTSLRIATAVGSKALRDEQALLVEQRMVYDPEQYKQERGQPIDWTKFGLDDVLAELDEDPPAPNYVKGFSSKVDILITTPGRLVDHLRSTPGFHLEDVQWVVIDEADRLLNESFQEWIDVVMPALKSHAGTRSRNELLRELRLEARERRVQKVVLSATMTQDISKLNSLDLRNPKLVAVGDIPKYQPGGENGVAGQDKEPVPDANGTFNVPPTLAEFAISVGDGSEKPLYLLKLIMSHILTPLKQQSGIQASSMASASSRSGSAVANGTALELEGTSSIDSSDTSDSDTSSYTSDSASSVGSHPPGTTPLAQTALIFTRSTEAATRLSRLLSLLSPSLAARLGTLTKSTHSSSSRKTLSHFRQGKIGLLVATDRASRGLDLPRLAHVISYDVPTSVTAYVHRVGRTARAGKEGKAWTLVGHREARWFWNEIGKAKESRARGEIRIGRGDRKVKRVRVDIDGEGEKEALKKRYEEALSVLGEEVRKKT